MDAAQAACCSADGPRPLALTSASRVTRSGACRMISSATMAPSECPARANRRGAVASTDAAISVIESSRSIRANWGAATSSSSAATPSHTVASPSMPGTRTSFSRVARVPT